MFIKGNGIPGRGNTNCEGPTVVCFSDCWCDILITVTFWDLCRSGQVGERYLWMASWEGPWDGVEFME